MIAKLKTFVEKFLKEREDLFLIEVKQAGGDFFKITIDGDKGAKISDCIVLNRALEKQFDSEKETVGFEVTTPDITAPILLNRQYQKNIGRQLKVTTTNEIFKGCLEKVSDKGVLLQWQTREPKPIGKGKITVTKEQFLNFDIITQAVILLNF